MSTFDPIVLAQAAPQSGLVQMVPFLLVLVIFYFILIRPQQQRAKEHEQLVESLKRNDQVVTMGGLHGKIVDVSESTVTLEIAPNVRIKHERAQISGRQGEKPKSQA